MITISPDAREEVARLVAESEPRQWFLVVSWGRGSGDNRRGKVGAAIWMREPDTGWVANLVSWPHGTKLPEQGEPLCQNVRLLVRPDPAGQVLKSGAICWEGGTLAVRANAI